MKKIISHIVNAEFPKEKRLAAQLTAVVLWLSVWTAAARIIDRELFLPGPVLVLFSLFSLVRTGSYWFSIANSMINILSGYLLALLAGLFLAIISYRSHIIKEFISLPLKIIRTVPVASFIILALLWISSERLSLLISFLMVLPIIYENTLAGLLSTDTGLLEMAYIVRMPAAKKMRLIYIPALIPHLTSALSTGAGLAWKSGVAAEVIGISRNSIGNRLYQSKIYLETPELFAWTLTIIVISLCFEKGVRRGLCRISGH